MDLNRLSSQIIKAAITVHKELGPGLLESVYHACMLIELSNMGVKAQSEVMLPVVYRGQKVDGQEFRLDLLVDDGIIVELKSVARLNPCTRNSC
jgi:GxxExxY protein